MPKSLKSSNLSLLDETAGCACLNLRGTARAVTQMYDEVLKPSGLKATQFSVLAAVATEGPASMTAISKTLVMDRTTLTRNLKPLLDRGLVQPGSSGDRRQRTISISPKGQAALVKALPLWKQAQNKIMAGIGFARWQGMARLLEETVRLSR
ncbi:MAG: winged helix-turn-helix transcriptional regulator [Rhodospirillales bacterium]|nr:winged helix-turn-helix transcriptional regulator [Rhodospirillales bacterium]